MSSILQAVLSFFGIVGLVGCAATLLLAWREIRIAAMRFVPRRRPEYLALLFAASCASLVLAWHIDTTSPASDCSAVAKAGAASYCAKLDKALDALGRIETTMGRTEPYRQGAPIVPGVPAPASLNVHDWNAITDHAIDKAVASRLTASPPAAPQTSLWPWVAVAALGAVTAALCFWAARHKEDKWVAWFARASLIITLATGLANCLKTIGEAGAAWAWAFTRAPSAAAQPPTFAAVSWQPLYIDIPGIRPRLPAIPVLFDSAREATLLHKSTTGIDIKYSAPLIALVNAMQSCGDADHKLALYVQGFANAEFFQDSGRAASDAENLDLANLRGTAVRDALKDIAARAHVPVAIAAEHWDTFAQMSASRPFAAVTPTKPRSAYDTLNRVALIGIESAGRCSVSQ